MKIVTAGGKQRVVMTRKEWKAIGKKAQWDNDNEPKEGDISSTWRITRGGVLAIDTDNHLVKVPSEITRAVIAVTGSLNNNITRVAFYGDTFVFSIGKNVHARPQLFQHMLDAGLSGFRCTEEGCDLYFS